MSLSICLGWALPYEREKDASRKLKLQIAVVSGGAANRQLESLTAMLTPSCLIE